jgi:hypothetical protein
VTALIAHMRLLAVGFQLVRSPGARLNCSIWDNRSAPVTLLDQGAGAAPCGVDTRPLAARSPRNSSVPCHGQVFRTSSTKPPGNDGRCVFIASGWQPVRPGFTNRWVLRSGRSNPLLVS